MVSLDKVPMVLLESVPRASPTTNMARLTIDPLSHPSFGFFPNLAEPYDVNSTPKGQFVMWKVGDHPIMAQCCLTSTTLCKVTQTHKKTFEWLPAMPNGLRKVDPAPPVDALPVYDGERPKKRGVSIV